MEDARANAGERRFTHHVHAPRGSALTIGGKNVGLLDFIFSPKKRSLRQAHEEAASAIEAFVDGRGEPWDWDDYESVPEDDPFLESIRLRCCQVPIDHPPEEKGHFCSPTGIEVLRALAREIREHMTTIPEEPIQAAETTRGK